MTEPVIHLQRREDGGLRVWSDDLPGLVLSGRDLPRVMADIFPTIDILLTFAEAAAKDGLSP